MSVFKLNTISNTVFFFFFFLPCFILQRYPIYWWWLAQTPLPPPLSVSLFSTGSIKRTSFRLNCHSRRHSRLLSHYLPRVPLPVDCMSLPALKPCNRNSFQITLTGIPTVLCIRMHSFSICVWCYGANLDIITSSSFWVLHCIYTCMFYSLFNGAVPRQQFEANQFCSLLAL